MTHRGAARVVVADAAVRHAGDRSGAPQGAPEGVERSLTRLARLRVATARRQLETGLVLGHGRFCLRVTTCLGRMAPIIFACAPMVAAVCGVRWGLLAGGIDVPALSRARRKKPWAVSAPTGTAAASS